MARVLLSTNPWQPFHTLRTLFPGTPPLGLQLLSSVLKQAGHEVRIADVQHLPPLHKTFLSMIESFQPDVVGFSNNCVANAPIIREVARQVKSLYPHLHVIAGGQAPTFFPQYFLQGDDTPFTAVGLFEGEKVIVPLVEALIGGVPLENVPGIAYLGTDRAIHLTKLPPSFNHADEYPFPDWENTLKKATFSRGFSASIETSRGCPYECSFCSIPGYFGRKPRYKSVDRIMEELNRLKKLGVTEFFIIDDSFGTNVHLADQLFKRMTAEKLGMRFGIQVRADIIANHPEMIRQGAKAGLIIAVVGFEGHSASVLADTKKHSSSTNNRNASTILRENGVAVYGTHVIGTPQASLRDNVLTFLLGRHFSDVFRMTIYTPLPGSTLFSELQDENRIRSYDPCNYYYGSYVIDDAHNPFFLKGLYFSLQLLHYLLPGTAIKALASPNPVTRTFNRRAYKGAFEFVVGTAMQRVKKWLPMK